MEVKIGETFNLNGKVLQACESTESNGCKGCFFEEYHPLCSDYVCAAKEREDGKDVIFKETKTMKTREESKLLTLLNLYRKAKIATILFLQMKPHTPHFMMIQLTKGNLS